MTGGSCLPVKPVEKLSLGNLKSQEWDQVWRRMDLKEIVPALFLLGQMVPKQGESKGGTEALLKEGLDRFVPAAFSNLLIPRLVDEQHQALAPATPVTGEPLSLLPKVYRQIRSFLIEEANPTIRILPKLPPDWDCGRAVGFHVEGLGDFDLEWSRNQIRKMVLRSHRASETKVVFAKPVDSYRLNGVRVENGTAISFEGGKIYTFDRFQK